MLIVVILVAFFLNTLTQLLLEGSVTRLFVGHTASLMPKWDEDFSSVLLRLGIASLEATSVAGLGNEVGGISLTEHSDAVKYQVQYGEVEMNRAGVSSITHATEGHEGHRMRMEGFSNEIRRVRVGPSSQSDPLVDTTWYTECKRFGYAVARFGLGCGRMIGRILRRQPVSFSRRPPSVGVSTFNQPALLRKMKPRTPLLPSKRFTSVFFQARCSAMTMKNFHPLPS
jgi:hypothetical protein